MFCKECGAELEDGSKFCKNCGGALEEQNNNKEVDKGGFKWGLLCFIYGCLLGLDAILVL